MLSPVFGRVGSYFEQMDTRKHQLQCAFLYKLQNQQNRVRLQAYAHLPLIVKKAIQYTNIQIHSRHVFH